MHNFVGSCLLKSIQGPNSSRFVGITQVYVELILQSCQFVECHRTMNFHGTHISLPITREEENTQARLKVEQGVRLSLEVRQRVEEEEEQAQLEAEEEERLVEEARLKAEEEDQSSRVLTKRNALTKKQGRNQSNIIAQG